MKLYVLRDRQTLAAITAEPPACDGVLMRFGQPDDVLASFLDANPLGDGWLYDTDLPGSRVLGWSGTLGEKLFQQHPATWLRPGHEALTRFCDEIAPQLEAAGVTLCLRPHARHVLSDPQSCLHFLREHAGQPFEIALAPAEFLEANMLDRAEDHLTRAFEALGSQAAMVLLQDVKASGASDDVEFVPLGEGVLSRDLIHDLMQAYVPAETPIALTIADDLESQRAWLGAATPSDPVR